MTKIICVGKNYLDHAIELGDEVPEMPVLFLKPPSLAVCAQENGQTLALAIPKHVDDLNHECEIIVRLAHGGEYLAPKDCEALVDAVTLGLDMTWRGRQAQLKKAGHPWEISKVFKNAAVVGPLIPIAEFSDYATRDFRFLVNGKLRQTANAKEMRLGIAECLSYISHYFPLEPGDLIFTGTPAGVGPIVSGDRCELEWGDIKYFVDWR